VTGEGEQLLVGHALDEAPLPVAHGRRAVGQQAVGADRVAAQGLLVGQAQVGPVEGALHERVLLAELEDVPGAGGQEQRHRSGHHRGHGLVADQLALQQVGDAGPAGGDRLAVQEPADVLGQRPGRAVAPVGLLLQALQADGLHVVGHLGAALAGRGRVALHVGAQDLHGVVVGEGRRAGQQLVEDAAQGVDVGPAVELAVLAGGLLRGHVLGRAHGHAAAGERARAGAVLGLVHDLGQAEVGDPGLAVGRDHDVPGLEVAVDDAPGVGVVQGPGHLLDQLQALADVERLAGDDLVERVALDVVHGVVGLALEGLELVDGHDVGVLELGGAGGLAVEALHLLGRGVLGGEQHLHGHHPAELRVQGLVDHAVGPAADLVQDFVVGEGLDRGQAHLAAAGGGPGPDEGREVHGFGGSADRRC
jgi:hypothetical protein